jgi:hypothetical protein
MDRRQNARIEQRRRQVRRVAESTNSDAFFDLLTGPTLLDFIEARLPEHRERLYPPTQTLSMFLAQAVSADRGCQSAVTGLWMRRCSVGLPDVSASTGGYCQARRRLPLDLVRALLQETARMGSEAMPREWRWRGRRVRLVDGTTLSMPDTAANQAKYPQPASQAPGLGFPLCRMVAIICLGTGVTLDAALAPQCGKGSDEQSLLRSLLGTLVEGDVLVGDAYYGTYFLLCELMARGVDGVFELHGARRASTDFRQGTRLGERDHLIEWRKPARPDWMSAEVYDAMPDTLQVRELAAGGRILISTLRCPRRTPKAALQGLYRERWHIELDLRHIKSTLGMEVLSCRSPDMVDKEIYVYLLAYNLIRLMMAQSALQVGCRPRQLSFKHAVQSWLHWWQGGGEAGLPIDRLLHWIAQRRVGNRPGRSEPRAVKRRPKPHPRLNVPRATAKANIRAHGHPRRVK